MISVITLTYKRHHILQEAIQSYLNSDFKLKSEMIIINDCPDVEYFFKHPNIRIINLKKRFQSIGKKLEFAFSQAKYDYMYRLDDDDLLTPWGLSLVSSYIKENPNKDIWRCKSHYLFINNKFDSINGSVNNGNCYSKDYISRINIPDVSGNEDSIITFDNNPNIFEGDKGKYSMVYRWGMQTYHISGMGRPDDNNYIMDYTDKLCSKEFGTIVLNPNLKEDYFKYL